MIRAAFRALLTSEGRRAWALMLLAGGGVSMTVYAGAAMFLVQTNPTYIFYLGLASQIQIAIVMTGFAGLLVKRTLRASIAGGEFSSQDLPDPATEAAAKTAGAALDKAVEIAAEAKQ